jgi:hypothetical protein
MGRRFDGHEVKVSKCSIWGEREFAIPAPEIEKQI